MRPAQRPTQFRSLALFPEVVMTPAPAPLTSSQTSALDARLRTRRAALRHELDSRLNTQDDPALLGLRNRSQETDDWAVADSETSQDIAEVSHDTAELREVEAALSRMADGTYGVCVECDVPIPFARLDAYPAAVRCIECQEAFEAAQRRAGTAAP
jgi:RNA polymerase-binding transcription factor DksA